MSGLVGVRSRTGDAVERATLEAMLDAIAHRGPDARAAWTDGPVGLGYGKFATTPEAAEESMPQPSGEGTHVVAADARLDNRDDLIDRLDVEAFDVVTAPDLLLAAYRRWGRECPRHLVGAFAFAIWDEEAGHLFCARDHVGIRPLYYHLGAERFLVGSEPAALFAAGGVPRTVDERYLADRLAGRHTDLHATVHEAVKRLEPGCTLTADADAVTTRRYWSLDPDRELSFPSRTEGVAAFRERFAEAVRCRLRAPDPVGSMLSGGLDSSSVACTARVTLERADRPALHTYTVDFDELEAADEREHVDAVLETGAFEACRLDGEALDPLADLEARLERAGGFFDPYLQHLTYHLYGAAAEDCRVLLDGYDGDTVVSHGIGRLAELLGAGRLGGLRRELDALADDRGEQWTLLRDHGLGPWVPPALRERYRARKHGGGPVERANPTIDADFAARTELAERLAPAAPPRSARERHHRLLTDGKLTHVLELADHVSAAAGIEVRYPFLDRRLMEFCLALPAEYKLHEGWNRWVLRTAMAAVLPATVRWRDDKADLHPYLIHALSDHPRVEALKGVDSSSALARYLDVEALHRVGARLAADGSADDAVAVARAAVLDAWLSDGVD